MKVFREPLRCSYGVSVCSYKHDTHGHADLGGEVEQVVGMVEGVVLLVDACEEPLGPEDMW